MEIHVVLIGETWAYDSAYDSAYVMNHPQTRTLGVQVWTRMFLSSMKNRNFVDIRLLLLYTVTGAYTMPQS